MSANLMKQPDEAAWSWLLQMKSSVDLKLRLLFKYLVIQVQVRQLGF